MRSSRGSLKPQCDGLSMVRRKTLQTPIVVFADTVGIALCIILAFYTRVGLEKPLGLIPLGHGLSSLSV